MKSILVLLIGIAVVQNAAAEILDRSICTDERIDELLIGLNNDIRTEDISTISWRLEGENFRFDTNTATEGNLNLANSLDLSPNLALNWDLKGYRFYRGRVFFFTETRDGSPVCGAQAFLYYKPKH